MTESASRTTATTESSGGRPDLPATSRTQHRRLREQDSTDRADLHAVLGAGFIAHLGLIIDQVPMVVPTSYGFDDHNIYLHGSVASRSLQAEPTSQICVTITLIDGLVLARSVFEHAVNYRSAMIYGTPRLVTDPAEKLRGLRCLSEHLAPGQWDYAHQPSRKELAATTMLAVRLDEASVKGAGALPWLDRRQRPGAVRGGVSESPALAGRAAGSTPGEQAVYDQRQHPVGLSGIT